VKLPTVQLKQRKLAQKAAHKKLKLMPVGNFTNILHAAILYKSVLRRFDVQTV
jgi:hypothetical protein